MGKDKYTENLEKFRKLAEAADFYLGESFHYINKCLEANLAGILFSQYLEKIDPTEEDHKTTEEIVLSDNAVEFFQNDYDILTEGTLGEIDKAWQKALTTSKFGNYSFKKNVDIDSIEVLGHLNNFAFFLETLVNRHLLFLHLNEELDSFTYNQLYRAKVLIRLTFIVKDELSSNKINLNEITNLFSLRNKTVHYTPDNAISLKVKLDSLIRIWKQTSKLVDIFQKREKFIEEKFSNLIQEYYTLFENRWLKEEK